MRYRISSLIGSGGTSRVYLARQLPLGRDVALKILPAEVADGANEARFEREARAASRLDHPGCVRVLDFGRTVDRDVFLAMEHLRGPTLAARLRRPRAPSRSPSISSMRSLTRIDTACSIAT
jgi:serine/threonine-protein kinase